MSPHLRLAELLQLERRLRALHRAGRHVELTLLQTYKDRVNPRMSVCVRPSLSLSLCVCHVRRVPVS